jgi:hypothetical protein
MRKDTIIDGLKKETFSLDDMENKIVVNEEVNIDPHFKMMVILNQEI